jgi:hypothetical protein
VRARGRSRFCQPNVEGIEPPCLDAPLRRRINPSGDAAPTRKGLPTNLRPTPIGSLASPPPPGEGGARAQERGGAATSVAAPIHKWISVDLRRRTALRARRRPQTHHTIPTALRGERAQGGAYINNNWRRDVLHAGDLARSPALVTPLTNDNYINKGWLGASTAALADGRGPRGSCRPRRPPAARSQHGQWRG